MISAHAMHARTESFGEDMKLRNIYRSSAFAFALVAAGIAQAGTITFATFSDPAPTGATPLFTQVYGSSPDVTVTGGWSGTGLTLSVPYTGGTYTNAKYTLDAAVAGTSTVLADTYSLGSGSLSFFDSSSNPLFQITFRSAVLSPGGIYATSKNGIALSGAIVPLDTIVLQQFAFSYANDNWANASTETDTASFTSSVVPEPATMAVFAIGLVGLAARRRRK